MDGSLPSSKSSRHRWDSVNVIVRTATGPFPMLCRPPIVLRVPGQARFAEKSCLGRVSGRRPSRRLRLRGRLARASCRVASSWEDRLAIANRAWPRPRQRCTVLLTGENGTVKELLARAIHGRALLAPPRAAKYPLSVVSCRDPANLLWRRNYSAGRARTNRGARAGGAQGGAIPMRAHGGTLIDR